MKEVQKTNNTAIKKERKNVLFGEILRPQRPNNGQITVG